MAVRSPDTLKGFFSDGALPTAAHFADLIDSAAGYATVAGMLAADAAFRPGEVLFAEGFRYRVLGREEATEDLVTAAGVRLRFLPAGPFVPAEAFGAAGDGAADDIAALERWRDHVEAHNRIGVLDGRTYLIGRTLYLTAKGSYLGCDGAVLRAAPGFARSFADPVAGALAPERAPVVFLDGRIEAIGQPNRRSSLASVKLDGAGTAPHGLIAAGVAAGNLDKVYVNDVTLASFVICGVQNARVRDLKGMAGSSGALPSEAALWILNGAKNTIFESCDMACAAAAAPAILRIGTSGDYPGPGRSRSRIEDAPSLITFIKGVFETQGNSEEPLRMVHVEAGTRIRFIEADLAAPVSVAMVEIAAGVNGVQFDGGATNGLGCRGPFVVNAGRDLVIRGHAVRNFKGEGPLIENRGEGRVRFLPPDNGLFGAFSAVFGGDAAHDQNEFRPPRYYGDEGAKARARADQATGARWWDAERNLETVWIEGAALTPEGMPLSTGRQDAKTWPVLTEADIRGGVLDLQGYRRATLRLSGPAEIAGMTAMRPGQEATILLDDGHATFVAGGDLVLTDGAPRVNPQALDAISFARANGRNLAGGASAWVQTGGPVGLCSAGAEALGDAGHGINAAGKRFGKPCWNPTERRMYLALGPAPADPWAAFDGAATITPA